MYIDYKCNQLNAPNWRSGTIEKKTKAISRALLTLLGVQVCCHLTINLFPVLNCPPDYFLLVTTMPYDISASDP